LIVTDIIGLLHAADPPPAVDRDEALAILGARSRAGCGPCDATDLVDASQRLDEELDVERRANDEYEAFYRRGGRYRSGRRNGKHPKPDTPPDKPVGKVKLTDPDSRLVPGLRGWVQGYNAQAA
jgi:hypothetical protein